MFPDTSNILINILNFDLYLLFDSTEHVLELFLDYLAEFVGRRGGGYRLWVWVMRVWSGNWGGCGVGRGTGVRLGMGVDLGVGVVELLGGWEIFF